MTLRVVYKSRRRVCGNAQRSREKRTYKYRSLGSGTYAARNFDCVRTNVVRENWCLELIRRWLWADEDDVREQRDIPSFP